MSCFASVVALALLLLGSTTAVAQNPADKTTPTLWSTPIVPLVQAAFPTVSPFDGNHIIVPQDSGSIVSLDSSTGAVQWTYTGLNVSGQQINQISIIPKTAVVVTAFTNTLPMINSMVALDPMTGAELWSNTNLVPMSVLGTEDVLLINVNAPTAVVGVSPLTGATMYTYTVKQGDVIMTPVMCGFGLACWVQVSGGASGHVVVFDIKAGKVLRTTALPVSNLDSIKHFRVTDFHIIVVYDRYVDFWRFGIAIAAVDLFNGAIAWTQSLPLAAASDMYPLAIGDGVVSLMIDLQNANGMSSTVQLMAFDQRSGAVVLNSTMNYTTINPFPSFSEIYEGRIWIGQFVPLLNLTAFDMATGQKVGGIIAPTTGTLLPTVNVFIAGTSSGPRWVLPNLVGVTVWDGLTGAFASRTTTVPSILSAQRTFDGKVILTTSSAVVALQP